MKLLYLDSSAFVKLYLAEAESEKVEELLGEFPNLASSAIAYAEVCGAFAVRFHRGDLGEEEYRAARLAFHNDWAKVHVCELEPPISLLAADIMKAHKGLRAMDALHLAAALALCQSVSLRFVTFDARLEHAAKKLIPEAGVVTQTFNLTLHSAYYKGGFFNARREFDYLIRADEGEITLTAGTDDTTFTGKVDRNANGNGTARIRNLRGFKHWLHKNFSEGDVLEIEIVSPTLLKIKTLPTMVN